MTTNNQELEVKFYLSDLPALERRLQEIGAVVDHERVHETNLRFDTPEGGLAKSLKVLRLRQDTVARVTYKGPGEQRGGARLRQEIEFTVSDFNNARSLFEALGYSVYLMYEKHRTTYRLGEVLVTLDEMPFGSFAEIEGPDPESITAVNRQLGLNWETRILDSYTGLFDRLCQRLGLTFRDLSFANFSGLNISPQELDVRPADKT